VTAISSHEYFSKFPMGPKLAAYLGLAAEDESSDKLARSEPLDEQFVHYLRTFHEARLAGLPTSDVIDLMDELTAMDLPAAVLDLVEIRPEVLGGGDFRAELATGVAAMLTGRLDRAEERLRVAQALLPNEPAPYVNLAQIFLSQDRAEEAELWCVSGLDAEPNHFALWDLLAEILQGRYGEYMPERLLQLAEKRNSWAGISLAASLMSTGDRYLKANLLERLYAQGERGGDFLVELTGAYGIAGQFEKIPTVVWQAERTNTKGLPWQLHLHVAQAQLAMGKTDECLSALAKAKKTEHLPAEAAAALVELEQEARASAGNVPLA
jgi:tetratricopeptide (TPR) repeat protein